MQNGLQLIQRSRIGIGISIYPAYGLKSGNIETPLPAYNAPFDLSSEAEGDFYRARFSFISLLPTGRGFDKQGNFFRACWSTNGVIKVTSDKKVLIFAKNLKTSPGLTFDKERNSPVTRLKGSEVVRITPTGKWIPL